MAEEESIGELVVRIKANLANWKDGLKEVSAEVKGLDQHVKPAKESLFSLKNAITAVVTAGAVKGAWDWIVGGAANMEKYNAMLKVTLGNQKAATEAITWTIDFAKKTPFEIPGLIEAVQRLSTYKLEYKDWMTTVGDLAAATQKPISQVIDAIGALKTGDMGEAVMRFRDLNINLKDLNEFRFDARGALVTPVEEALPILKNHIDKTFGGMMAEQAKTFGGVMSNIKDTIGGIGRAIAGVDATGAIREGGLFDKIRDRFIQIYDTLQKLEANGTLEKWSKNIGRSIDDVVSVIGPLFKGLSMVAGFILDNWPLIGPVVMGALAAFMAYKSIGFIQGLLKGITEAQRAWNLAMTANPIGLIIAGIAGLITAGYLLIKNWDAVKEWFAGLWKGMVDIFTKAINAIKRLLGMKIDDSALKKSGEDAVKKAKDGIQQEAERAKAEVEKAGRGLGQSAADGVKKASEDMQQNAKQLVDALVSALQAQNKELEDAEKESIKKRLAAEEAGWDTGLKLAKKAHDERIRLLDEESRKVVETVAAQIRAIDELTKAEDKAAKVKAEQEELDKLSIFIGSAEYYQLSIEEQIRIRDEYNKKYLDQQRKFEIDSLQQSLTAITEHTQEANQRREELIKEINDKLLNMDREYILQQRELMKETLKTYEENTQAFLAKKKQEADEDLRISTEYVEQEKALIRQATDEEIATVEAKYKRMNEAAALYGEAQKMLHTQTQEDIIKLLKKYEPNYITSGARVGENLARGLRSQIANVRNAAQELAQTISDNLELHSPAKEGPLANINAWWRSFAPTLVQGIDFRAIKQALQMNLQGLAPSPVAASAGGGRQIVIQKLEPRITIGQVASGYDIRRMSEDLGFYLEQELHKY